MTKRNSKAPAPPASQSGHWLGILAVCLGLACFQPEPVAAATGLAADTPATIALLNFSVPSAETNRWAWAEGGLADLLQTELQQRGLVLLDRDMIHAVLNEQRMAANGVTAGGYLALGKLLNAQYLISGKFMPLADGRFQIEADAFSVEAVETRLTARAEGAFPKDLPSALQSVARQISRQLPGGSKTREVPPPPVRAPKPESLILFYRGLNACAAGQPEGGAACFMSAASLDPDFTVPLLWEIKAYEMAGLANHAAIRRAELADILKPLGLAMAATNASEASSQPVIAVLNPVVTGTGLDAASLAGDLQRALLAEKRVRVFAYEGIGAAVAEQDLRLSSFFASQNAPRYGRWLTADGLLLCRVGPAEHNHNQVSVELSLVNPVNASVISSIRRTMSPDALPGQIPKAVKALLADWLSHAKPIPALPGNLEAGAAAVENQNPELRPVYQNLVAALGRLRREPETSDVHRAMADAFAAVGRPRLAAYEIEQCLKSLDIHAPGADTVFLGTHRWLFWEPSPASGAAGLVDRRLIDRMIEQLLTTYPQTLAAGCMRYNLAVTAWREKRWPEAIAQAQQSRRILQALIAQYDRKDRTGANRGDLECEMTAATYFLEGASLREAGRGAEAGTVLHQGLAFIQAYEVRDFCLPLGPYIGSHFGPERVYGYGGDSPGIRTRLEQQLTELEGPIKPPTAAAAVKPVAASREPAITTNSIGYWLKQGEFEMQNGNDRRALGCYQEAAAKGASVAQCPGLAAALLEIALDQNPEHPRDEIEKLRQQFGFPPVQASWVDWFAAGRKYQSGRQFDFEKAAASYRGALDFLEHPEQMDIYHLEPQPNSSRVALRWGPSLGEVDLQWSDNYDRRWYSAAFYLAQCLIKLDRKEEAAQWLRQIALKLGGDNAVPLLERDDWHSSGWASDHLGVRAAELLQELHDASGTPRFGEADGPFKVPPAGTKARPLPGPALPAVKPELMQALTNALTEAAGATKAEARNTRLQTLVAAYGHDIAPAALSLLSQTGGQWDEDALIWLLERSATSADAPWLAAACVNHWSLAALSERLDPTATATALAEAWREHDNTGFAPPGLVHEITKARVRPLYALVLEQIAEKRVNHHADVFLMDPVVRQEKSAELEAAFRDALTRCLRLKLAQQDHYELKRISQVALQHGVAEGIDGLLVAEGAAPEKLRAALGTYLELPQTDPELIPFLRQNQGRWQWNPDRMRFELPRQN